MKQCWVKQSINKKEWIDWYQEQRAYCYLGEEGIGREKKVKMGFLLADIPTNCSLITDENDLLQIDNYRKHSNIFPRPFTDVFIEKKEQSELNF